MDTTDSEGGISLTVNGTCATIWFDRQKARNAMLLRSWLSLPRLIELAQEDPAVRTIIFRGASGHFGAGNDIAEFGRLRGNAAAAHDYGWAMARAMKAVELATKPTIAAIEGACFGASVALALAADIRLASGNARLAITPAKLGAVYLKSDHHRLVAAIGPGSARRMIFTAMPLDAQRALAIGLLDEVATEDRIDRLLADYVEAIASGSPYTLLHSKRMLRMAVSGETPDETNETIGWFVDAMMGRDFAEGVDAFLSKRNPDFAASLGTVR